MGSWGNRKQTCLGLVNVEMLSHGLNRLWLTNVLCCVTVPIAGVICTRSRIASLLEVDADPAPRWLFSTDFIRFTRTSWVWVVVLNSPLLV